MANRQLLRNATKGTEFGKIMAITPFKVTDFWNQSKTHIRFPISD